MNIGGNVHACMRARRYRRAIRASLCHDSGQEDCYTCGNFEKREIRRFVLLMLHDHDVR